jgi:hypothetical protein
VLRASAFSTIKQTSGLLKEKSSVSKGTELFAFPCRSLFSRKRLYSFDWDLFSWIDIYLTRPRCQVKLERLHTLRDIHFLDLRVRSNRELNLERKSEDGGRYRIRLLNLRYREAKSL